VHETVHELIQQGKVGKISTIEANEDYYAGKTYFRRWNRLRKFGGGLWLSKACHDFDLLCWMASAKPKQVFATGDLSHYRPLAEAADQCRYCSLKYQCQDFVDYRDVMLLPGRRAVPWIAEQNGGEPVDLCLFNSDKDTFDNGIAVVDFDNGIHASYTLSVISACATRQMRVVGDRGTIEADMDTCKVQYFERHTNLRATYDLAALMDGEHGGADVRLLRDFFKTCKTGQKPRSGWAEGRQAVQLSLAARQSMDTNIPVEVESITA